MVKSCSEIIPLKNKYDMELSVPPARQMMDIRSVADVMMMPRKK